MPSSLAEARSASGHGRPIAPGKLVIVGYVAIGLIFLIAACLNWRYVEHLSAAMWGGGESGRRHARWLAEHPWGNKIGGTAFLAIAGTVLVIRGVTRLA